MYLSKKSFYKGFLILLLIKSSASAANDEQSRERVKYYNTIIPKDTFLRERILTGLYCLDVDDIPKHQYAGHIVSIDGKQYQLMHNGIKVLPDSYYGNWMTLLIQLLHGHHEPQEEVVFHEVLKSMPENATMIELGAYWGFYSLWFQKEVVGAKNYLIEPDAKNLMVGQEHFECNDCKGDFTFAMIGKESKEFAEYTNWDYQTSLVPQVCIDDFIEKKQISYIHILHSDIQGAEVDMLAGCKSLIKQKKVGYFFISTHRGTHEKCLEALKGTEYEILLSITREESFSADGLIIAKSPDIDGPTHFSVTKRTDEIQNFIKEVSCE